MDEDIYVKYPFMEGARKSVQEIGLSLNEMLEHPVYSGCLEYGLNRFEGCMEDDYRPDLSSPTKKKLELLGYPVARLLAHATGTRQIIKKYAQGEANITKKLLEKEKPETIKKIFHEAGIKLEASKIPFNIYLNLTKDVSTNPRWNLVNRELEHGKVKVDDEELPVLISEYVKNRVSTSIQKKDIPKKIKLASNELKIKYAPQTQEIKIDELEEKALPPCIKNIIVFLENDQANHQSMFTLATFLINLGLDKNSILSIFKKSPKFNEDTALYQIEFLSGEKTGTEYTCPTCETIKTHGQCVAECQVKHPIQFYRQNARNFKYEKNIKPR